ncbi:MAG TPA: hypothetical protein VHN79_03020, partial [Lacunisphaera sp.]|nr:hypothetical protein [Lacunisphaera sp.]
MIARILPLFAGFDRGDESGHGIDLGCVGVAVGGRGEGALVGDVFRGLGFAAELVDGFGAVGVDEGEVDETRVLAGGALVEGDIVEQRRFPSTGRCGLEGQALDRETGAGAKGVVAERPALKRGERARGVWRVIPRKLVDAEFIDAEQVETMQRGEAVDGLDAGLASFFEDVVEGEVVEVLGGCERHGTGSDGFDVEGHGLGAQRFGDVGKQVVEVFEFRHRQLADERGDVGALFFDDGKGNRADVVENRIASRRAHIHEAGKIHAGPESALRDELEGAFLVGG